jgi:flagellin FlaB
MNKIKRFFKGLHRSQKGITGLETAIILIAFVTVASVLAYSVLSAGIFSSEKGKSAVYNGLSQASASMELRGSVLVTATYAAHAWTLNNVIFTVASVLQNGTVDMTAPANNSVVINYTDSGDANDTDMQTWTATLIGTERGDANSPDLMDSGEAFSVTVPIPGDATLAPYSTFTIQIIPPKGAAITITRTLPAAIATVMDLN